MKSLIVIVKFIASVFTLGLVILGIALPVKANVPMTPSQQLHNFLAPIHSIRAKFTQQVVNTDGKILQTANGTMQLQRPHKIYWEVLEPDPSLLVSNGEKIWNYEPSLEQVTIQNLKGNINDTPLGMIFTDQQQLDNNFVTSPIDKENSACLKDANFCFKLEPKKNDSAQNFQRLEVGFVNQELTIIRLLDQLGQTTIFRFTEIENNPKIKDSVFSFVPPEDVDIIGK